jgi:hypothetical protein
MDSGGYLNQIVIRSGLSMIIASTIISQTITRGETHIDFTPLFSFGRVMTSPKRYYTKSWLDFPTAFFFYYAVSPSINTGFVEIYFSLLLPLDRRISKHESS